MHIHMCIHGMTINIGKLGSQNPVCDLPVISEVKTPTFGCSATGCFVPPWKDFLWGYNQPYFGILLVTRITGIVNYPRAFCDTLDGPFSSIMYPLFYYVYIYIYICQYVRIWLVLTGDRMWWISKDLEITKGWSYVDHMCIHVLYIIYIVVITYTPVDGHIFTNQCQR